ncbi:MAG: nucleoside hydrolase [Bacteroidota bacterium]|nr:nucleoside hydrolase [Bacteroidota bacterium]
MDSIPVIVDTDAGLDDLLALGYLLAHPAVQIKAVTMAYGLAHGPEGQRNVARLLALCGRSQVPVYPGIAEPLQKTSPFPESWCQECRTLPGVALPDDGRQPESESAVSFLQRQTGNSLKSVRILALGALTNLAALVDCAAPGLREIVSMGGAFEVAGNLVPTPSFDPPNATAEWNCYVDPLAAHRVLTSTLPVTLIPLDATCHVPVTPAFIDRFDASARGPHAEVMSQVLGLIRPQIDIGGFYAWDCLAAMYLTNPEVVSLSQFPIEVRTAGPDVGTTRQADNGPVKRIAYRAHAQRFEQLFLQAFA